MLDSFVESQDLSKKQARQATIAAEAKQQLGQVKQKMQDFIQGMQTMLATQKREIEELKNENMKLKQ